MTLTFLTDKIKDLVDKMATDVVRDKDLMKQLYHEQAAETDKLYLNVGYFIWMAFWDTIKEPTIVDKIMKGPCYSDCVIIYKYFMNVMNVYIDNKDGQASLENVNNMIFNRNMIMKSFHNKPSTFVNELKFNLRREKRVVDIHNGIDVEDEPLMDGFNSLAIVNGHMSMTGSPDANGDTLTGHNADAISFASGDEDLDQDEDMMEQEDNSHSTFIFDISFLNTLKKAFEELESLPSPQQFDINDLEAFTKSQELRNDFLNVLKPALQDVRNILAKYRYDQKLMENKLEPEVRQEEALRYVFNSFAEWVTNSFNMMPNYVQEVINEYMNMCLVISQQPKCFILVQNESGSRRPDAETQSKKGSNRNKESTALKETRQFNTKKKASISVAVDILGFKHLPNLVIHSHKVTLLTERGEQCGELYVPDYELKDSQMIFNDITVRKYTRGSGSVRHQFVRLSIQVKVGCFDQDFELTTKTLPFYLCTGAVQELELIGMRMWYCASNQDMYSECKLIPELPAKEVFDFLDKRLRCACRERPLSNEAKKHLMTRIPGKSDSVSFERHTITEKAFVKEKIVKTEEKDKDKSFTFFTWFYGFVNSIETHLLQYWRDGIIYDLMTSKEAQETLLNDDVPLFTALIRPANQYVQKPNCTEAVVKLAVAIKLPTEENYVKVNELLITMSLIEKQGFYKSLASIGFEGGDSNVIKYIMTKNGPKSFHRFEEESQVKVSDFDKYYRSFRTRQVIRIEILGHNPSQPQTKFPRGSEEPVNSAVTKRKPCRRRTSELSTSTNENYGSPESCVSSPPMASPSSRYENEVIVPFTPAAMAVASTPAAPNSTWPSSQVPMQHEAVASLNAFDNAHNSENRSMTSMQLPMNGEPQRIPDLLSEPNSWQPINNDASQGLVISLEDSKDAAIKDIIQSFISVQKTLEID